MTKKRRPEGEKGFRFFDRREKFENYRNNYKGY